MAERILFDQTDNSTDCSVVEQVLLVVDSSIGVGQGC